MAAIKEIQARLQQGLVIPACPLALNAKRHWDERHQRALFRYYLAAGAGGLSVGVHTTQVARRDAKIGLVRPVLQSAADELRRSATPGNHKPIAVGGICGQTPQAIQEVETLCDLNFDAGLLSLGALRTATEDQLIDHCRTIARIIPLFGFYLQPAAGGRPLSYSFWRRFAEIDHVVAIKIAPFNRYQTLDVVRAVADSGRADIALYTGNDDNIVLDLLTPFSFEVGGRRVEYRIVGGLLGHWAVWTRKAVELHARCREISRTHAPIPQDLLRLSAEVTDANAALFDAAHQYAGCIPGIHEVLRRQGLLEGSWCLDPTEALSPGQSEEINRVCRAYPHLNDDPFVQENLPSWLP